jgi:hypothetical protein
MNSRSSDNAPWLVGSRTWFLIGVGLAVAAITVVVLLLWEQRSHDRECERLERRVVTNQEEADRLFDERAEANCLGSD